MTTSYLQIPPTASGVLDSVDTFGDLPPASAHPDEPWLVLDTRIIYVSNGSTWLSTTSSSVDAAAITSGTIDILRIPPAALERLVVVADQTARYALTTATVQNGDTVKQTDTGEFWYVVDDTHLNGSSGYAVYTAGTASAVAWSGITSKPGWTAQAASSGVDGYLSGANWTTFNGKQNALSPGNATTSTVGVTVSGTGVTVGPAMTIDIATASSGSPGLLSAADWSTFNGKQAALTSAGVTTTIRTVTSDPTVAAGDHTILCDCTGGAITVNLPAASSNTGRILNIKKVDSGANAVTIDANSTEKVDGALTQTLSSVNKAVQIQCDGSNWYIISTLWG